jgi:hypothetical protein
MLIIKITEVVQMNLHVTVVTPPPPLSHTHKSLANTRCNIAAGPEDMDADGYGTADEDKTLNVTPVKMTINEMRDWLTESGHENIVWDLTQAKAKKPKYIEEMNKVLGRL